MRLILVITKIRRDLLQVLDKIESNQNDWCIIRFC